jgi:hypothetical protein
MDLAATWGRQAILAQVGRAFWLSQGRLLACAERMTDDVLGARIHATAAQTALAVFHRVSLDHPVHVEAHRAVLGAPLAVNTHLSLGHEAQRGPAKRMAQLAAQDHEWCHPTDSVAARTPPEQDRQPGKEGDDSVIDRVPLRFIHRDPAVGQVEKVYLPGSPCPDSDHDDEDQPRCPDKPLDPT